MSAFGSGLVAPVDQSPECSQHRLVQALAPQLWRLNGRWFPASMPQSGYFCESDHRKVINPPALITNDLDLLTVIFVKKCQGFT